MHRRHYLIVWTILCSLAVSGVAGANLTEYAGKPDPEYAWTKQSESMAGTVKVINLKLRSQVWRGIPWDHTVQIFLPAKMTYAKTALLFVTGGSPNPSSILLGAAVSPRLEGPVAVLYDIPNQPLFNGLKEDDLIAHTFQEYLNSGDESWPLLFPMVKSAIRAMDAIQAFSKAEWAEPVQDFVVTGASKRGWTTYLTGATDKRVRAIAPMVFDNLNFQAQMPRQLELWGRYSEQIEDYTRRGLQQKMSTEVGKKLVSMVDPWFYRKSLTMPKLLIHGANDRYWATDAARLYWDDLTGDKYLLTIPNAGHGLEDQGRLLNGLTAFFHAAASDKPLPRLTVRSAMKDGKVHVQLRADVAPDEGRLWVARADRGLDFRPLKWEVTVMKKDGDSLEAEVDAPGEGGLSFFAEGAFTVGGRSFTLTSPSAVLGKPLKVAAVSPE